MAYNSQLALHDKKQNDKIPIEASAATIIHNMERELSDIISEILSKPQKAKLISLSGNTFLLSVNY